MMRITATSFWLSIRKFNTRRAQTQMWRNQPLTRVAHIASRTVHRVVACPAPRTPVHGSIPQRSNHDIASLYFHSPFQKLQCQHTVKRHRPH